MEETFTYSMQHQMSLIVYELIMNQANAYAIGLKTSLIAAFVTLPVRQTNNYISYENKFYHCNACYFFDFNKL